jgi:hypothetical protein
MTAFDFTMQVFCSVAGKNFEILKQYDGQKAE